MHFRSLLLCDINVHFDVLHQRTCGGMLIPRNGTRNRSPTLFPPQEIASCRPTYLRGGREIIAVLTSRLLFPSALIKMLMLFMTRGGAGETQNSGGVFKEISRMKPAPTLQVLVSGLN